jgi:large subunit ribosomal protein L10
MNAQREQKQETVSKLNERFAAAPAAILVDYQGTSCEDLTSLRRDLRPSGAVFSVVKNTLAKRAVEGTPAEGLREIFQGPIAVVWTGEDPVSPAKILKGFAKTSPGFKLKAGVVEGEVVDSSGIEELASLPTKEELISKLLALINAPATQLLRTINEPACSLARVLAAWKDKLEQGEK